MNTSCTCRPRPLALLQLTMLSVLWSGATARAVIDVGSVTVPSIGHSFFPPQPDPPFPPFPGFAGDLLIGGENGGATLSPVTLDLDTDTQISFTIRAPLGQKFLIEPPDGAAAFFSAPFAWFTFAAPDSGTSLGASVSFQDLVGTAPTFSSHSTVGADNQFFTFDRTSASFTGDLSFTAVTLTVTYAPRATGNGTLTYQPYNPQNSTIEPRFLIGYSTALTTDPGRFVSLVPLNGRAWDSGGASDLWSDAGNWDPDGAPANGDSLIFGSGARTTSQVDYTSLSVNALAFTATAPAFTIHVPESGSSRQLTITGPLTNSGAIEQTLIADGATAAGMNSGVLKIASPSLTGAFALVARGSTGAGPNGGVIEFSGPADATRVRAVTEPGTYFDFSARVIDLRLGSLEGGGLVLMGGKSLLVGYNDLNTEFSGTLAGGATARLEKFGTGTLILSESNTYGGGTMVHAGTIEVRAPINQLGLGGVSIFPGGEMNFSQNAVAGFQAFGVGGSFAAGEPGGVLRFSDSATAGRITLLVQGALSGLNAGSVIFEDSSTAGTSTNISIGAGIGTSGVQASATFRDSSAATGTTITNHGATSFAAGGGLTAFRDNATAATAVIANEGGTSGTGGSTRFFDAANAGASVITNLGTLGGFLEGQGRTEFFGNSTAGSATITNRGSPAGNGDGGKTSFWDNASAGAAWIVNESAGAGIDADGGRMYFENTSSAGSATILNRGTAHGPSSVGATYFEPGSSGGNATILSEAGSIANGGGVTAFSTADAANATVTAQGSAVAGAFGRVLFDLGASAGQSTITAEGATVVGGGGGYVVFVRGATAQNATLIARSGLAAGAPGGLFRFLDSASAASGGTARAIIEAGAALDISGGFMPMTIGSIEGAGTAFLGIKELIVGGNDASTTFSGTITDGGEVGGTGGALTKTGAGALTLAGINSYTGTTTVLEGILNLDTPLHDADIDVLGGVLNISGDVTGSAVRVEPIAGAAIANFYSSQQLESLTIGDGGLVVLGEMLPPAPAGLAVPEPGTLSLFLLGMLPLLRRKRAPFQNSSTRMIRFPREIRMEGKTGRTDES